MKTAAIVKIGYGATYVAPSADVAAKIVTMLSKCQAVEDVGGGFVEVEPDSQHARFVRCEFSLVPESSIRSRIPRARRLNAPKQEATP